MPSGAASPGPKRVRKRRLPLERPGLPDAQEGSGGPGGMLTTDRASHDLRAPCSMRIAEVNARALEDPALARLSPTGEGWLIEIQAIETSALA